MGVALRTPYRLFCFVLLLAAGPARAQPTNLEAYQTLALRCLAAVPDTVRALRLEAPAQMPYLRTALVNRWRQDGRTLFVPDSSVQVLALPRLRYAVEAAEVAYARAGRRQLQRTVTLALRYTFTAPDGRLLADDRCRDTFTDAIRRTERDALESGAYPETQGAAPPGSWRRRYLEPALLGAATAVTIFLFFNLRSDRSGDL